MYAKSLQIFVHVLAGKKKKQTKTYECNANI